MLGGGVYERNLLKTRCKQYGDLLIKALLYSASSDLKKNTPQDTFKSCKNQTSKMQSVMERLFHHSVSGHDVIVFLLNSGIGGFQK